MKRFENFNQAYIESVRVLMGEGHWVDSVKDPSSIGCAFGVRDRRFCECIGYSFILEDPRKRIVYTSARAPNYVYAYANLVFFLSGSSNAVDISPYNKRAADFAAADGTIKCSLGWRCRAANGDQLSAAVSLLKADRSSRRAIISFYDAGDVVTRPKDTPCAISLQFFNRDETLHAVCNMRSQSAVMVMPYDVHLFTTLQELVAAALGLRLGNYIHICNSFHVYEDELTCAKAILDSTETLPTAPEPLITNSDWSFLKNLVAIEREIRAKHLAGGNKALEEVQLELIPQYSAYVIRCLHESLLGPIPKGSI